MRLRSVELKNFKRFTDLRIEGIPDDARLVLMIGANGSGKSSVFDAFEFLARRTTEGPYYRKDADSQPLVEVTSDRGVVSSGQRAYDSQEARDSDDELRRSFYGRSSMRVVPRNEQVRVWEGFAANNTDAPKEFILPDLRFNADVQMYTETISRLIREPVFADVDVKPREIFDEQIRPLNEALLRVFGDDPAIAIQLSQFQSAEMDKAPVLEFRKGKSRITYDVLSHGEKQVVILLLNFMVRREHLRDKVIFIDEMDGHMHRSLQYRLLQEITEYWIPESSQLWTATHALGFIEYASNSNVATVLDFDELDFDLPQVIVPLQRSRPEVFDIAIDRDLIARLATLGRIVLVEGKDKRFLQHCGLSVSFSRSDNKQSAFVRAQQMADEGITCLVDRDYVTDVERLELLHRFPFLRMLQTYCIENELYHPDNVREACLAAGRNFDQLAYENAWLTDLDANRSDIVKNLSAVRQTYGFFFPENQRKAFAKAGGPIFDKLQSRNFADFFPYFSAKTYGATAKNLLQLEPEALAKTSRFKLRIEAALAP